MLFEEHSTSRTMPYLFNGKELDSETNLTYFGARYLDMKTSLWLNTDPLSGYNPIQETEHYIDGQHNNGVFNPMNHNTYGYTYNNPVIYVDPNGKQTWAHAVLGFITADAAIPEPTDATWPKWAVYAVAGGVASVAIYINSASTKTEAKPISVSKSITIPQEKVNDKNKTITLYRGVATDHDKYKEALLGIAVPGNDKGEWNPIKHNTGKTKNSIFTSWTTDEKVANYFGTKNGEKGIVLKKKFNIENIIPSPDFFHQGEWLVPGVIKADEVKTANPNNTSKYKSTTNE